MALQAYMVKCTHTLDMNEHCVLETLPCCGVFVGSAPVYC